VNKISKQFTAKMNSISTIWRNSKYLPKYSTGARAQ